MRQLIGRIVTVAAVLALHSPVEASPAFKDIARARILGVGVEDIAVQGDGSLRLKGRIEVECASMRGVKPSEGRCFAPYPRKELGDYYLRASYTSKAGGVKSVALAVEITGDAELAIRADDLVALAAVAEGSAAGTWSVELVLIAGTPTNTSKTDRPEISDDAGFSMWNAPAQSHDEFALFEKDGIHQAWCAMDNHFCGAGMEGMVEQTTIDVGLPTNWVDHAGKQMLAKRGPELTRRYRALAVKNVHAFARRWIADRQAVLELASVEVLTILDDLVRELPAIVADRTAKLEAATPSLDRSAHLYEELQHLGNALGAKLPANVMATLTPPVLDKLVSLDVASFVASPQFPGKEDELAEWYGTHEALLHDPRYAEVLIAYAKHRAARKAFPAVGFARGDLEPVIATALQQDSLRDELIGIAKSDVELAFGKDPQTTCDGDPVAALAGVMHLYRIGKDRILATPAGTALALRTADALTSAKQFSPTAAEAFLQLVPALFAQDSEGQAVALRVSTRVEERRRVVRQDQLKQLVARQTQLVTLCQKSMASARSQEALFKKRVRVMTEKERTQRRTEYQKTSTHVGFVRAEMTGVLNGVRALMAQPEAERVQRELASCQL